jgi:hypothetical protein
MKFEFIFSRCVMCRRRLMPKTTQKRKRNQLISAALGNTICRIRENKMTVVPIHIKVLKEIN